MTAATIQSSKRRASRTIIAANNLKNNQNNLTMDYASAEDSGSVGSQSTRSLAAHNNTIPNNAHYSRNYTASLSLASLGDSSNSLGSRKAIGGVTKIQFKVENKKNWAPTEIASRSQVYALRPNLSSQPQVGAINQDIIAFKNGADTLDPKDKAVLIPADHSGTRAERLNHAKLSSQLLPTTSSLGGDSKLDHEQPAPGIMVQPSYIKVSNMMHFAKLGPEQPFDPDGMTNTIEATPVPGSSRNQKPKSPVTIELKHYRKSNKNDDARVETLLARQTAVAADSRDAVNANFSSATADAEEACDDALLENRGTQVIQEGQHDEFNEELMPVDEEEWAQAVKEIVAQSARQFLNRNIDGGQEPKSAEKFGNQGQSHGFLINVESTKLIEDHNNSKRQAMMDSGVGLSLDSSMRREEELEILEAKNRYSQEIVQESSQDEVQTLFDPKAIGLKLNKPSNFQVDQSASPPLKQKINLQSQKQIGDESNTQKVNGEQSKMEGVDNTSSLRQIDRDKSNVDISEVYEMDNKQITFSGAPDQLHHLDHMGVKTSTDFTTLNNQQQKHKGNSMNTLKLGGQSEYNKSSAFFVPGSHPPYGFTLKQRESLMMSGFRPLPETDESKGQFDSTVNDYTQMQSQVTSRTHALKSHNVNPILKEALKKAKQGKIVRSPVRQGKQQQQQQDAKAPAACQRKFNLCVNTTTSATNTSPVASPTPKVQVPNLGSIKVNEYSQNPSEKDRLESPKMKTGMTLMDQQKSPISPYISPERNLRMIQKEISSHTVDSLDKGTLLMSQEHIRANYSGVKSNKLLTLSHQPSQDLESSNLDKARVSEPLRNNTMAKAPAQQNVVIVNQSKQSQEIESGVIDLKVEETPEKLQENAQSLTEAPSSAFIIIKSSIFNRNTLSPKQAIMSNNCNQPQISIEAPIDEAPAANTNTKIPPNQHMTIEQNPQVPPQKSSPRNDPMFHIERIGQKSRYPTPRQRVTKQKSRIAKLASPQKEITMNQDLQSIGLVDKIFSPKMTDQNSRSRVNQHSLVQQRDNQTQQISTESLTIEAQQHHQVLKEQPSLSFIPASTSPLAAACKTEASMASQATQLQVSNLPNPKDDKLEFISNSEDGGKGTMMMKISEGVQSSEKEVQPKSRNHNNETSMGVTISNLQSVYPPPPVQPVIKETATQLNKIAHKFNQYHMTKIMDIKPLRASKNYVSRRQQKAEQNPVEDTNRSITIGLPLASNRSGPTEKIFIKKNQQESSLLAPSRSRPSPIRNHAMISADFTPSMDSFEQRKDKFITHSGSNSKGSNLSMDLQHLDTYSPIPPRNTKDPREKTRSNFNNSNERLLQDGENIQIRLQNNATAQNYGPNELGYGGALKLEIDKNMSTSQLATNKHGGIVLTKKSNEQQQLRQNQNDSQAAVQVQTSFEELLEVPDVQIHMEEILRESPDINGSHTPRSNVQVQELIAMEDQFNVNSPTPQSIPNLYNTTGYNQASNSSNQLQ